MLRFTGEEPGVNSFSEYLVNGGFPEFLRLQRLDVLQQLFDDIVTRDVIVRYKLRSAKQVISMATYLISNAGNEFSYTRLKNTFKLGSTNTAIDHVAYLEDAYLLLVVPRFDYSYQKQLIAPKKVYAIDTGLAAAVSTSFSSDSGRVLENVVFLQLKRSFKEILYYKEEFECDFLIKEKNAIIKAIQVCHDFSTSSCQREVDGLVAALDKFKLDRGLIITFDNEDEIQDRGKRISVMPAWKWIMSSRYP